MSKRRRGNPQYRLDRDLIQVEETLSKIFGVERHRIRRFAYAWGLLITIASLKEFDPKDLDRMYRGVKEMVLERIEELKRGVPQSV